MIISKIQESLFSLIHWLQENGDAGYDPYDIKGLNEEMLEMMKAIPELTMIQKFKRYFIIELFDNYFPRRLRNYYDAKPKIHPTSQGILFDTYLNLYTLFRNQAYLNKANIYKEWLIKNRSNLYNEYSWGTPFHWRSGNTIYRAGEPFAVVNAWIGNAFFKSYKITANQNDIEICDSICKFFSKRLHIIKVDDNRVCFSYSAIKPTYINNSNLFVAEFLIRTGKEINNPTYIELGLKAADYSISTQLSNGALPYFGPEENKKVFLDSYHSGYEIRMLYSIYKHTGDKKFLYAAKKYFNFFIEKFLHNNRVQTKPNKKYPVDATSVAETMLLLNAVGKEFLFDEQRFEKIINWAIDTFQTKNGWFIYKIQKPGIKIKIPYIRWVESWMALALSEVLVNYKS